MRQVDLKGPDHPPLSAKTRRPSRRSSRSIDAPKPWDIHTMDCLEGMSRMRPASVHFIATDPPYFLDGMGDDWNKSKLNRRVKPGVIGGLPAGMKFDKTQGRKLISYMERVAAEMLRILKPGGFAAVFSQARLAYATGFALDAAGFEIRDMLAWQYQGQAKAFSQDHFVRKMNIPEREKSRILAAIAGKKTPQLKPQFEPIVLAQKPKEGTFIDNWLKHQTGLMSPDQSVLNGGFPGTLMDVPKPKKSGEFDHITVKPVPVMRQLIGLFTVKNQIVCDPFAGSGTTGVAALRDKRRFIGFEIDPDYAKVARRRIADDWLVFFGHVGNRIRIA